MKPYRFAVVLLALAAPTVAQNCNGTSINVTPLTDMGAKTYQNQPGGLYPNALNVPPAAHHIAALNAANNIVPLDTSGKPSASGKIVLLSIGMSNTTQEYSAFIKTAKSDPRLSKSVVLVDGAQGGQDAKAISSPTAQFWTRVDQRLSQASTTGAQVQAVWLKQAIKGPTRSFPTEVKVLQGYLETICNILKTRFPNLQITFFSSRIYAGYATTALNPEPHAFESGYSVKWLIQDQINGKATLNFDPNKGTVKSSLLLWGPYLWADGLNKRSDGLTWVCSDFRTDGTHPSSTGQQKVADMLLAFFTSDPTATPWFVSGGRGTVCSTTAGLNLVGTGTSGSNGIPYLTTSHLPHLNGQSKLSFRLTDARPSETCMLVGGAVQQNTPLLGGTLYTRPLAATFGQTNAFGFMEWSGGLLVANSSLCGLKLYWQGLVVDPKGPVGIIAHTPGLETVLGN
jgi:hypothetical protein